jgi:hypothetical protein
VNFPFGKAHTHYRRLNAALNNAKNKFNKNTKRANPGASVGSTDVNITDVNKWAFFSRSRTLSQRVRDPLHATNPYDRLAAVWAEQLLGHEYPFNTTFYRSSLY